MAEILIEQALYCREGLEAPRLRARSAGILDEWLPGIEELVLGFGDPPREVSWPTAVYAQPFGKQHVAVVQVTPTATATPLLLDYHVLFVPRSAYNRYLGDPFAVARLLPPPSLAANPLPPRTLPAEDLPARTVTDVQAVLKKTKAGALEEDAEIEEAAPTLDNALSPALLGGVQVLVDGGRVVFERPRPDPELVEGLWTLLPTSTRCHLWPASFTYSNALRFDAAVTPHARAADFPNYTSEEQAADYPEGRYERRLQIAAEAGDQGELNALFARRSVRDTMRMAIVLVVIFSLGVLGIKLFDSGSQVQPPSPAKVRTRAAVVASLVGSPSPLNLVSVLPVAQKTWNLAERE